MSKVPLNHLLKIGNATLTTIAQTLSGAINELNTLLASKVDTTDLATVATSGSYTDLTDKPTIDVWTSPKTLAEGATSVTFTGLNAAYAYDIYSETADGTPVNITGYTVSGTSITYTCVAITAAQAGISGTDCKVKLKCMAA